MGFFWALVIWAKQIFLADSQKNQSRINNNASLFWFEVFKRYFFYLWAILIPKGIQHDPLTGLRLRCFKVVRFNLYFWV
jgi:hypothetical protein